MRLGVWSIKGGLGLGDGVHGLKARREAMFEFNVFYVAHLHRAHSPHARIQIANQDTHDGGKSGDENPCD